MASSTKYRNNETQHESHLTDKTASSYQSNSRINNIARSAQNESETRDKQHYSRLILNTVGNNVEMSNQTTLNIIGQIFVSNNNTGQNHVITISKQSSVIQQSTVTCGSNSAINNGEREASEISMILPNNNFVCKNGKSQDSMDSNSNCKLNRGTSAMSLSSTTSTTKPPTYSSLQDQFLNDEPPKYQDVTGKELATELQLPSPQTRNFPTRKLDCKSRVFLMFALFGVVLVTTLVAYYHFLP